MRNLLAAVHSLLLLGCLPLRSALAAEPTFQCEGSLRLSSGLDLTLVTWGSSVEAASARGVALRQTTAQALQAAAYTLARRAGQEPAEAWLAEGARRRRALTVTDTPEGQAGPCQRTPWREEPARVIWPGGSAIEAESTSVALESARRRTCFGGWERAWAAAWDTPGAETSWALHRATERLTSCLTAEGQVEAGAKAASPSGSPDRPWCALARGGGFVSGYGSTLPAAREAAWLEHFRWGLLAANAGVEPPSLAILPDARWEAQAARCGPTPTIPSAWAPRSPEVAAQCGLGEGLALSEGPRGCGEVAYLRSLATLPQDASPSLAARSQTRALACLAYCQVDAARFPRTDAPDLGELLARRDLPALLRATAGGAAAQGAGWIALQDADTYWSSLDAALRQTPPPGRWLSLPDGPVWQIQAPP